MFRRKNLASSLALLSSIGLFINTVGCVNNESGETSATFGPTTSEERYSSDVTRLKQNVRPQDYDESLIKLQEKYGIQRQIVLPENKLHDGLGKKEINNDTKPASAIGVLPKAAGTVYTGTYTPAVIYTSTVYLSAGDVVEYYTSNGSSGVDPVLVLFDVQNQSSDFKSTGIINSGGNLGITYIYTHNDDFSGRHPKITYTATESGYYGVQCYPYSSSSTGTVTLTRSITHSGTTTTTNTSISVVGTVFKYSSLIYPTPYIRTENLQNGADPWLWMWSYSWNNGMGAENDDAASGQQGLNSDLANTAVYTRPTSEHYLNCVVMGGYSAGGTATWVFWN